MVALLQLLLVLLELEERDRVLDERRGLPSDASVPHTCRNMLLHAGDGCVARASVPYVPCTCHNGASDVDARCRAVDAHDLGPGTCCSLLPCF